MGDVPEFAKTAEKIKTLTPAHHQLRGRSQLGRSEHCGFGRDQKERGQFILGRAQKTELTGRHSRVVRCLPRMQNVPAPRLFLGVDPIVELTLTPIEFQLTLLRIN